MNATSNTPTDLAARLRVLEDIEAIRRLKARYFFCCDQKNPQGMRDCFAPGNVPIDYGPIGVFDQRDALAQVFAHLGCHAHIVEMHHGLPRSIHTRIRCRKVSRRRRSSPSDPSGPQTWANGCFLTTRFVV